MAEEPPKRRKPDEKPPITTTTMNPQEEDRISTLPDSLLCHILSFLPTKTSMATSILSPRWRHLHVFDFNDKSMDDTFLGPRSRFVRFVFTVLARRRVRHIKKFRLICTVSNNFKEYVLKWIQIATSPHLQELDLHLFPLGVDDLELEESFDVDYFFIPQSVLNCPSLVSLTLYEDICFEPISSVHLPSLKNLTLHRGKYPIDLILSGCPVIETLDYFVMGGSSVTNFCINSLSLKSLTFRHENDCPIDSLEINTPSLEFLNLYAPDSTCHRFSICDLPNIVEAHLEFSYEVENAGFGQQLLAAIRRTKILMLDYSTMECLLRDALIVKCPKFCRLHHLEISTPHLNLSFIMDLLQKCDYVQFLQISTSEGESSNVLDWTLPDCLRPTSVPNCVKSHLTTISIGGYVNSKDEHAFIAYILENGLVLRKAKIHLGYVFGEEKAQILKDFSDLPRRSDLCQLEFDGLDDDFPPGLYNLMVLRT